MARMVNCINGSFAKFTLDRSQAQRYSVYSGNLFKVRDKVLFDDRLRDAIIPYILPSFDYHDQIERLNHLKCEEDGTLFSRSYYNPDKIEVALDRFHQPSQKSFRYNSNYQWALKELMTEFSVANLKMIDFASDQDIAEALPKLSTHSGMMFIITGNRSKGDNLKGIYQAVETLEKSALENGNCGIPIMCGHRTQGNAHDEFSGEILKIGKHKTRLVCMVDMRVIVIELKFAKPLQNWLSRFCPWYSGGKTPDELRSAVYWGYNRFNYWTSLDYSSFDQTISDWLIEDAFLVIRQAFNLRNDYESKILDVIRDSFIHKDFLISGGKVIHSDKGVPSGSMFTQIIDSIVNMLMILTYMRSIGVRREDFKSNVMGDDHLLQHQYQLDLESLESYLKHNFGITMNANKCVEKSDKRKYPWYLSREFRGTGEWRHPNVLFDRLLFPERMRPYFKSEVIPEDIIYCFIQTYPLGMRELIDVNSFMRQYDPTQRKRILDKVDGIWLPGSYTFNRDYNLVFR